MLIYINIINKYRLYKYIDLSLNILVCWLFPTLFTANERTSVNVCMEVTEN